MMLGLILLVILVVAAAGAVALVLLARRRSPRVDPAGLPFGADAALWSVTEVLPDPRNHLAIKDPTSEMRLTDEERRAAAAEADQAPGTGRQGLAAERRPAERAAEEQRRAARQAALEKHDGLAREKQRRALVADRDPAALDRYLAELPPATKAS